MPRGKGTYGSKVGRPSKKKKIKKMYGGGAKPMAKSLTPMKKGGTKKKKKLKKYQTAGPKTEFMDAVSNVNFVPFRSEADQFATKLDQLDSVDRQIMDSMMKNNAANRAAARQAQMEALREELGYGADLNKMVKFQPFGTETNPIPLDEVTIPGNRKTGGSVIKAKTLRNYSRGGARKNR